MPLELNEYAEYVDRYSDANIGRFNCGRSAITAAALSIPDLLIYIPYYNCSVVRESLERYGIPYRQYYIDENMEPIVQKLDTNEWLLYVNYFGCSSNETIYKIVNKYKRVIFDNTQAFFAEPILDGICFNVYSPRKFVGVCDGAYLIWSGEQTVNMDYPRDISWEKAGYLFKSIELGTNVAYSDNLKSKDSLSEGIKLMSVLSRRMLRSIDYNIIIEKRNSNFKVLHERLQFINKFRIPVEYNAPFVYPLYVENNNLRSKLVENKIYVSQWWKYLIYEVKQNSYEARLSKWLFPLPIDQRYTNADMESIADIVFSSINCEV